MQKIADIFFLSKTAVSLQIKTILRWIERNPKLELEVSSTKGLKIIAEENSKNFLISCWNRNGDPTRKVASTNQYNFFQYHADCPKDIKRGSYII